MKSKITTFLLFIIMIMLLIGIVIFARYIYIDLFADDYLPITYKIDTIATEEPETNKNKENKSVTVNGTIQSILNTNYNTNSSNNASIGNENKTENSINRYFYNQLNQNQKKIYNGLYDNKYNLKQGNYVINYGGAFSDLLSQEGGSDELTRDYQTAVEAFTHDNPELFYLDVNKMYINIQTITRFLKTTYNVYITPAEGNNYLSDEFTSATQIEQGIQAVEKVKNSILAGLNGTDYQNIMFIHDYLINNIEYDSTYEAAGSYSIYGALIGKKCVCEGYAKAFKYLTNAAGYECELMQGTGTNSQGETETHAWNCIKCDGTWYLIDVTWDDPIIIGGGKLNNKMRYSYFLKGTSTFKKDHVTVYNFSENGKEFLYPNISINDY